MSKGLSSEGMRAARLLELLPEREQGRALGYIMGLYGDCIVEATREEQAKRREAAKMRGEIIPFPGKVAANG